MFRQKIIEESTWAINIRGVSQFHKVNQTNHECLSSIEEKDMIIMNMREKINSKKKTKAE